MAVSPAFILESVTDDRWRRALTVHGQDVLLDLRSVGTVTHPRLLLTITGDHLDDDIARAAARLITQTFRLGDDPTPFLTIADQDPVLGPLLQRYHGLRPLLLPDPFEALCWAITGQQIHSTFARKLKGVLETLAGRTLTVDGQTYGITPTPAAIAALDPDLLGAVHKFSRAKTAALLTVARAADQGDLDLDALRAAPFDDGMAALTRFKGVGRWTAEYVLLRSLGANDAIPAADAGLRAIIGRRYGLGRSATEAEVREMATAWAPYRGWAAFTWWFVLGVER